MKTIYVCANGPESSEICQIGLSDATLANIQAARALIAASKQPDGLYEIVYHFSDIHVIENGGEVDEDETDQAKLAEVFSEAESEDEVDPDSVDFAYLKIRANGLKIYYYMNSNDEDVHIASLIRYEDIFK